MLEIGWIDYSLIAFYFLIVYAIAWVANRQSSADQSEDYFLGGRNLGWFVIGASLFVSNIGSEHLVGLAGTGAASGVAVAQFEILAGLILLLLGWVFAPFYLKSGVATMPEFLEMRYCPSARTYLSVVSVVSYVLTKISVTIYAGAVIFESIGVPFWIGALIVVVATGGYTVVGGLRAVIYTDTLQLFIMLIGSLAVTFLGLHHIGGWSELKATVGPEFFNMWKPMSHPDFPWTGIIFGAPILGIWYWCTDQFIVQRVLAAKNLTQARKGTIFGGLLKMLPLFIFVFPGIICAALAQKGLLTLSSNDAALPTLSAYLLPVGARGLVVAGLLAALMSSLSSVFNSCSTLITYDFYKRYFPATSEKKLVFFGQMATIVLVIIGVLWIPMMKMISGQLYTYLQSIQAYISPPIASVFLLGLFFRRLNGQGAMWALISGLILGTLRLFLELNQKTLTGFWFDFATVNFLHFALYLFLFCSLVLVVVSFLTQAPDLKKIESITYDWSAKPKAMDLATKKDMAYSVVLVLIIALTWIYFTG